MAAVTPYLRHGDDFGDDDPALKRRAILVSRLRRERLNIALPARRQRYQMKEPTGMAGFRFSTL